MTGVALGLALALTGPTNATAQDVGSDVPVLGSPAPGAFVWQPELSHNGEVKIVVSVPMQQAFVYRGGVLIAVSSVSTGKPGHETPTGTFPILEKAVMHHSNLYNDAAMPFMERLTWDGVALHAGRIPGRPASHGCVRLPMAFAKLLYGVTRVGAVVTITGDAVDGAGEAPVTMAPPSLPANPAVLPLASVIAEQTSLGLTRVSDGASSVVSTPAERALERATD